jgi:RNA polymerase sigma-70 factor, ECF subfamily
MNRFWFQLGNAEANNGSDQNGKKAPGIVRRARKSLIPKPGATIISEALQLEKQNVVNSPHDNNHSPPGEVTELLHKWRAGDNAALETLLPIVYRELRRIADSYLRRESSGHTLQATALVNEAYMRLVKTQGLEWQNREQFFGISANLMRQILVDHARRNSAAKRGGRGGCITLDESLGITNDSDQDLLLLDAALTKLGEIDPFGARVVELRYFTGLTIEETAQALNTSPMTVKREWTTARLWLHREIAGKT